MEETTLNLVPDTVNPSPDYYCTWQTQLYATSDGKPDAQRQAICEDALFRQEKPYGWAYFYEQARRDLYFVMDDSWDVPPDNDPAYYGSLVLNPEKFPNFTSGLNALAAYMESIGWKGLGGWICAQESPVYMAEQPEENYWIERLKAMNEAGIAYWKVDWGEKAKSFHFRKMLTDLGRKYAPNLTIEHAMLKQVIPYGDVFRTYDVPAIMSIPMTFEKLANLFGTEPPTGENKGLINCEDEAYIAAAGGFAMGIMRHPYTGDFPNGRADMSFPKVHRNLKSKLYEVIRAAHWHRIAPAFSAGEFRICQTQLEDRWQFENVEEELEAWWLEVPSIKDYVNQDVLTKRAPAALSRNTLLPCVFPDKDGNIPYCIVSRNPNGAFSVATLGRTINRDYFIPKCRICVDVQDSDTVGIFGEYAALSLTTKRVFQKVFMQDLAGDTAYDVTDNVLIQQRQLTIPGDLITKIGTWAQPSTDTSEPGVVLKLI